MQLDEWTETIGKAALKIAPLAGSKAFIRVGNGYRVDPDFIASHIDETKQALHLARIANVRLQKDLTAAQAEIARVTRERDQAVAREDGLLDTNKINRETLNRLLSKHAAEIARLKTPPKSLAEARGQGASLRPVVMNWALKDLSHRATQGIWQRSGARGGGGHMIGPDGDGVTIVPYDPKHHTECLANADFLVALVNAYRAGDLVEAPK